MTSRKPIRKAVFPVAGLGTRFLPATKAIPKEMLPIVDRPLIQYAVDEAREAGIEQMIFVTGRGKSAIEDHFDIAFELEKTMSERGKDLSVLEPTRLGPGNCAYVRQQEPLGPRPCDLVRARHRRRRTVRDLPARRIDARSARLHGADGRGVRRGRRQPHQRARSPARGGVELRRDRARRGGVGHADRSHRPGRKAAGRRRRRRTRSSRAATSSSPRSCACWKRRKRARAAKSS